MTKGKLGAAAASAPKGDPTGKYTLNGWGGTTTLSGGELRKSWENELKRVNHHRLMWLYRINDFILTNHQFFSAESKSRETHVFSQISKNTGRIGEPFLLSPTLARSVHVDGDGIGVYASYPCRQHRRSCIRIVLYR